MNVAFFNASNTKHEDNTYELFIGTHRVGMVSLTYGEAEDLEGMPLDMAARAGEFEGGEIEQKLNELLNAGVKGGVRFVQ
jgi:hypothetical protein